ncbi:MAG: hypothetical protein VW268_08910 [Rhodospirillaceae bacterium]
MSDETAIRDLESRAAECWPAFREANLEGWRVRFADGVSRRANSVLALDEASNGVSLLTKRIDAAEVFYAECGQPCRFKISGGVQPRELDAELERRG